MTVCFLKKPCTKVGVTHQFLYLFCATGVSGGMEISMTEREKLDLLEEIMDVEEETLEMDMVLSEIEEWDSLSFLTLIVEAKKRWGKVITTETIESLVTVSDVCALFGA